MRIVIALGGNALLQKDQPPEAELQQQNISAAARAIAEIANGHELAITHGNGPQVGLLALQAESYSGAKPYPLDILDAESEGMLGYQVQQALMNALPERQIVALLTQVLVDEKDSAFKNPTKPVGAFYPPSERQELSEQHDWELAEFEKGLRRLVPSPEPKEILELPAIKLLVDHGMTVVCSGGGGIPVVHDSSGKFRGVAAVIDKDFTSALLATALEADVLLLLTDVDAVYQDWGKDNARPLKQATVGELRSITFETGTMAPKIEAACRFVEATGNFAYIGHLNQIANILAKQSGTKIMPG
ncbi:MAG: carbamate kinase [Porticoccaceae bacterium]|nr:carbamate kinase [Porticoccaceae bacterium]